MLVHGAPYDFVAFFEYVSPENREQLYQEALAIVQFNQAERAWANNLANMSERNAANAVESLMVVDLPLALRAMELLRAADRAAILDAMEPPLRATIIRMLAPIPPEFHPLTPPYLALPVLPPPDIVLPELPPVTIPDVEDPADEEDIVESEGAEEEAVEPDDSETVATVAAIP
jgi:hypothetical protein